MTVALQLAAVCLPALNAIFVTAALTARELVSAIGISSVVFIAVEIEKWLKRSWRHRDGDIAPEGARKSQEWTEGGGGK